MSTSDGLRRAMDSRKITIELLSEISGVHANTIGRLRKRDGSGNVYTWIMLADALGVSMDEILGRNNGSK